MGKGEFKSSIEFTDECARAGNIRPKNLNRASIRDRLERSQRVAASVLALDKGLSLSDHSFKKVKGGKDIFCATEEEVYKTLGLQWIPPELREGRDEVALAKANKLPKLIEVKDIKANLHMHSTYSDGKLSMLDMAKAAIKRGLKVIVFSDHSVSLGVANGLSIERHKQQAAEIKKIQKQLGDKITILHSSEVEIKADGSLDYPDDFLASLDLVVASLHSSLRQPREKITERLLKAVNNPHVDIIGHPTGREIPDREGADLDMEVSSCKPRRNRAWRWRSARVPTASTSTIRMPAAPASWASSSASTPTRTPKRITTCFIGVAIARCAGVLKDDVINCWSTDKLLKRLKKRG
ncbi:MAG: PHP domain-containing protein [Anaerolineales bacterium]